MKKKYKKPQLFMESFEVAEFIAGTCDIKYDLGTGGEPTYQDAKHCNAVWDMFAGKVFLTDEICEAVIGDELCYNGPNTGAKTWLS